MPFQHRRSPGGKDHMIVMFCGHVDAGKASCFKALSNSLSPHPHAQTSSCGGDGEEATEVNAARRTSGRSSGDGFESNSDRYRAAVRDYLRDDETASIFLDNTVKHIETQHKRITLANDRRFVQSLVASGGVSSQFSAALSLAPIDAAILVISARLGEFECAVDGEARLDGANRTHKRRGHGSVTRQHIQALRCGGVQHIVCAINKMDAGVAAVVEGGRGATNQWDRYKEIISTLTPIFIENGYKPVVDGEREEEGGSVPTKAVRPPYYQSVVFVPISAQPALPSSSTASSASSSSSPQGIMHRFRFDQSSATNPTFALPSSPPSPAAATAPSLLPTDKRSEEWPSLIEALDAIDCREGCAGLTDAAGDDSASLFFFPIQCVYDGEFSVTDGENTRRSDKEEEKVAGGKQGPLLKTLHGRCTYLVGHCESGLARIGDALRIAAPCQTAVVVTAAANVPSPSLSPPSASSSSVATTVRLLRVVSINPHRGSTTWGYDVFDSICKKDGDDGDSEMRFCLAGDVVHIGVVPADFDDSGEFANVNGQTRESEEANTYSMNTGTLQPGTAGEFSIGNVVPGDVLISNYLAHPKAAENVICLKPSEFIQVQVDILESSGLHLIAAGAVLTMRTHAATVEVTVHKILAASTRLAANMGHHHTTADGNQNDGDSSTTTTVAPPQWLKKTAPPFVKPGDTAVVMRLELARPTVVFPTCFPCPPRLSHVTLFGGGGVGVCAVGVVTKAYLSTRESLRAGEATATHSAEVTK